jgi:hypothetical protein
LIHFYAFTGVAMEKTTSDDVGQTVMSQAAQRAIGALVPFWDALQSAGQGDDYQTITEALQVIQAHIKGTGEQ